MICATPTPEASTGYFSGKHALHEIDKTREQEFSSSHFEYSMYKNATCNSVNNVQDICTVTFLVVVTHGLNIEF